MSEYADALTKLTAKEMKAAMNGDPDRAAEVLERLLSSAAFTIALMSGSDKKMMSELLMGAEAHLLEEATRHGQNIGKIVGSVLRR